MARIRTIKPEFFSNESLSALAPATHLLAAALLCYADDEGYFLAHPGLIRASCLPLREDSGSVPVMIQELSTVGYVEVVTGTEGKLIGRVVKFKDHQVISHARPSQIKKLWPVPEPSSNPPVIVPEASVLNGIEGNGIEQGMEGGSAAPPIETPELPKPKTKPLPEKPPAVVEGSDDPMQCAKAMFEHLAVVAPPKTLKLAAEAIRMQAAALCTTPTKAMLLIRRQAEMSSDPVNAFWFEDSKWKSGPSPASVGVRKMPDCPICENRRMVVNEVGGTRMALQCECVTGRKAEELAETAPEGVDTELGARIWTGINKALKSELGAQSYDTWIRPIKPLGALNGELYLQIPSPDFANVGDRYDIARFLPAGVDGIHLLSATGAAA